MNTIASNKISIFPSSTRTGVDAYSRFTSEYNIATILNRLADHSSYVKTFGTYAEFTLGGYFFRILTDDLLSALSISATPADGTTIYAAALVNYDSSERVEDSRLVGYYESTINSAVDVSGSFIGAQFTTTQTDFTTTLQNKVDELNAGGEHISLYTLTLAVYSTESSSWGVPGASQLKFNSSSVDITLSSITTAEIDSLF